VFTTSPDGSSPPVVVANDDDQSPRVPRSTTVDASQALSDPQPGQVQLRLEPSSMGVHDKPDSRTATGLAASGPTDNALAWCATWAGTVDLSVFPA
jgi:hypothetical protein